MTPCIYTFGEQLLLLLVATMFVVPVLAVALHFIDVIHSWLGSRKFMKMVKRLDKKNKKGHRHD